MNIFSNFINFHIINSIRILIYFSEENSLRMSFKRLITSSKTIIVLWTELTVK